MLISIIHTHLHLNMEGVAGPVRHIIIKLVVVHNDVWPITIAELRALNVNDAACCTDILSKFVPREDHGAFIALYHENRHVLYRINDDRVIELFVWVNYIFEKVI